MDRRRARLLRGGEAKTGGVLYWMSRDQRADDNWALLYAQELAVERNSPLAVLFCLVPVFLGAARRQYGFMIRGLEETAARLALREIPCFILQGEPAVVIPPFVSRHRISCIVTDFDPLRIKRRWKAEVADILSTPLIEVDAHNIVPCWLASPKEEIGARTLRPKLRALLPEFLTPFPTLIPHPFPWPEKAISPDWEDIRATCPADREVTEVGWCIPGEAAAGLAMNAFLASGLAHYHEWRNDPTRPGQSGLSPYLHFGQLSPQRLALEVSRQGGDKPGGEAFLEELIVRRELSDNFCYYNDSYDSIAAFPGWARASLAKYRNALRPYRYSSESLERGSTHDPLWNAAQMEMVATGRMHGYLRMYWGKKLLEWSDSPEEALATAISLNDRYQLDGRDPNGYAGIAWSIGGVHDRAWPVRPLYGKVRSMTFAGCARKFDVNGYIEGVAKLMLET